jgi:hypothetical protein
VAISVVVSSLKIDVTSTGGVQVTLDDICTEINDTSVMEKTGTIYLIKRQVGSAYREFEISSGCKVLFEADDTLNFEGITSSGTYVILDFATNSEIEIEEGFTFDFNSDGQTYARAYLYIYGQLTMVGTLSNNIVFKNYRSCYISPRNDQYWRYVTFKNATYYGGYLLYYSNYTAYYAKGILFDIQYVTVTNDPSLYYNGRLYITNSGYIEKDFVFRNWTVDYLDYPLLSYQGSYKFVDCIFSNSKTYPTPYTAGGQVGHPYLTSKEGDFSRPKDNYQPLLVFENCLFDNLDLGVYGLRIYYNSNIYLKNCEIKDSSAKALYLSYGSFVLINGITYTNCATTPLSLSNNSASLHVREVSITVVDINDAPIEKACVSLRQAEDKEWHCGFTNSDGKLLNGFGDPSVLIEKEETSYNVFDNWSDDISAGRYHIIQVSKDGYTTKSQDIEITEDKDITIKLYSSENGATTIINSTMYDCVIY